VTPERRPSNNRIVGSPMTASANDCEGASSDGRAVDSAFWSPAAHLRLWPIAVAGLVADLWSKHWAFTALDIEGGRPIIEHFARFQRSLNTGALFGLGKGWTPLFIAASVLALAFVMYLFAQSGRERWSLHVALGLVLAGALGNLHDRIFVIADVVEYTDKQGRVRPLECGIINEQQSTDKYLALGNYPEGKKLIFINRDQVIRRWQQGVVRDFIKMEPRIPLWGGRHIEVWPWVYNIADVLLVVGVAILLFNFWRERRAAHALPHREETSATRDKPDS